MDLHNGIRMQRIRSESNAQRRVPNGHGAGEGVNSGVNSVFQRLAVFLDEL